MSFRILALTGGGFFGYYTACVLARLEEQADRPLARQFDLLAGTSVGGIIALALAKEIPARDIKRAFEDNGTRIFSDQPKAESVLKTMRNVVQAALGPRFDAAALRETIAAMLGAKTRLAELTRPVLIPTVDLADARARLFATYNEDDQEKRAADVAMAGAAMPTFFPMAEIDGRLFADGGLFANMPDLLAFEEAVHTLAAPAEEIRILSVGTATGRYLFPEKASSAMGGLDWIMGERLMRTTMAAQQSDVVGIMTRRLGDRYLRIDTPQTRAQQDVLGLHVATKRAQRLLSEMADTAVADTAEDPRLARFLEDRSGK